MWKNIGKWALRFALWAYGHRSEILAAVEDIKKEDAAKAAAKE